MASKRTRLQNALMIAATTALPLVPLLNQALTPDPFPSQGNRVSVTRTANTLPSDLSPWSCGKKMVWRVLSDADRVIGIKAHSSA